uniref:Uncharacterized protein n=1 Tax=Physcomitrium patens TaxID=3218 RepID=A0A2K1IU05_PHYPA|nr:hypothetical protein PHYPA_024705 [Physcomitrium patens]
MGIDAKVIQAGLFSTTSTALGRRAMLEETMRRGSDMIGIDVPSEHEINLLRQEEGYKSRLMEEHEVPEWVFLNDYIATDAEDESITEHTELQYEEAEVKTI